MELFLKEVPGGWEGEWASDDLDAGDGHKRGI